MEELELLRAENARLKIKSDKWDALDQKLADIYGDGDDDNEQDTDLGDIGEICAIAFGYL